MTDVIQTQTEANIKKVDILKPKTVRRVGCWNVRTLYQTGKLAQVIREMENNRINLLCLSETRWVKSGMRLQQDTVLHIQEGLTITTAMELQ